MVYNDHSTLKYLLNKKDSKPRPIRYFYCKNLTQKSEIRRGQKMLWRIICQDWRQTMVTVKVKRLSKRYFHIKCFQLWPIIFHDARDYVLNYDSCQRSANISKKDEILQLGILKVEIFYVQGINFIGPFPNLDDNSYILVCVKYMSKWVKDQVCSVNDTRVVCKFKKKNSFVILEYLKQL